MRFSSARNIGFLSMPFFEEELQRKRPDTVGQPLGTAIGVPNMPSLKAKKLGKFPQGKVLLER
jgi:hypothetical protein